MGRNTFSFCLGTELVDRVDAVSDARFDFAKSGPFVTNAAFAHFDTKGGKRSFAARAYSPGS